jgi:hypothetical protein
MSEVSEIAGLEKQVTDAKFLLERRDIAIRLAKNTDFRKLILDGFCLHDAARYAQESADPALNTEQRTDALNIAQASGHLKRFLSITIQMGAHAERTMSELEEALADARAEEGAVV